MSEFALKTAKDNGRNNYYIYSKTDYDSYKRKLYISKALHNAVNEDFKGFQVFYQPVVDASTYMLTGAEALMRFSIKKKAWMSVNIYRQWNSYLFLKKLVL